MLTTMWFQKVRLRSKMLNGVSEKWFVLYFTVGGNAGLAAAYSARKLKIPCTIVVPGTTPMFMVERLREEGATVEICGDVSCLYFM